MILGGFLINDGSIVGVVLLGVVWHGGVRVFLHWCISRLSFAEKVRIACVHG